MDRRRIIYELKASDHLKAECPRCGGEFALSKAIIFDSKNAMPAEAAKLVEQKELSFKELAKQLREQQAELKRRKHGATAGAEKKAKEIGLGLVVEKIITSWDAFPHQPFDCRSLFEPIDYVAFDGMTIKNKVELIAFLDVKTGESKLNFHQRMIRDAIQGGRIDYLEV